MLADNRNDVILTFGALLATVATQLRVGLWWVDPTVAILLASCEFCTYT